MIPALGRGGVALLAAGAATVVCGALIAAWPLLALGILQISAVLVLYLLFLPYAALLRQRGVELAWWVPGGERAGGALIAGRSATLHIAIRNRSRLLYGSVSLRIVCSSAVRLEEGDVVYAALPPCTQVRLERKITLLAAGYWFFHGLQLRVVDRFGLFAIQAYFPNLLGIKVFPPLAVGSRNLVPFRPRTGASHERVGRRLLRQRGFGSDLRELRDHTPGDPFKHIAWKATARTGKLMVREFESEIVVTQWLLLDISPTMREGRVGATKLDYALAICAALSRQAVDNGDRVGLLTFDTRVYSQVKPRDGRPQLYQIVDRLMELHNIVDEDLTDLTDAELYSAVAEYMAYQEGLDLRVRRVPPQGSPLWNELVLGVGNTLIDLDGMVSAVRGSLKRSSNAGAPSWWSRVVASTAPAAQLRLYCRLRGLEIPYRKPSPLAAKHAGMTEALGRASTSRAAQLVVLISDLEEIGEPRSVLTALGLARRRNHSIAVVAPYAPAFFGSAADLRGTRLRNALALRHQRQRATMKMSIERLGVPVFSVSPEDDLERLILQMRRGGVIRRTR